MKTAAVLALPALPYPEWTVATGRGMLAFLGVGWILLLMLTTGEPSSSADLGLAVLTGAACVVIGLAANYRLEVLEDAWRVLAARRAPDALWQAWTRDTLMWLTRCWAVLCAALAAHYLAPASQAPWLVAPALLSLSLSLAVLGALSRIGLARRGLEWGRALGAIGFIAGFGWATLHGWRAVVHAILATPAPAMLLCALAWPALAWALWRRSRGAMPAYRPRERKPGTLGPGKLSTLFKRYSLVRWHDEANTSARPTFFSKLPYVFQGELLFYLVLLQMLTSKWGSAVTPLRALALYIICTVTANRLAVRDLHWRSLLLPGGLRRDGVGTHIIRSTLTLQLCALAAIGLAYLAFQLATGTTLGTALERIGAAAILPFELAFTTSAAVVMRGIASRRLLGFAGATAIAMGIAYLVLASWTAHAGQWTIGPLYLLVLAAGTALLWRQADRIWTVEKLFTQIRKEGI
jgi:hypothetical protein